MKRIALVESSFGENVTNPLGGIWQITNQMQQQILSNSTGQLSNFSQTARNVFGSEIANMSDINFDIPLRSALAAHLYIQLISSSNIPGSVQEQAMWWRTYYHPGGSEDHFIQIVNNFESNSSCTVYQMDLWFLLDGSGSVSSHQYQLSLQFISNLSREFNISLDQVRTGFSVYSSRHYFISYFNQNTSNSEFSAEVLDAFKPGGGTATGSAIDRVVQEGFNTTNGGRPLSDAVPRVLVVLTDGRSGDRVIKPSNDARAAGITVYGVGIGSGIDVNEINEIANDPDSLYSFLISDFDHLVSVLRQQLIESACDISVEVEDNTTVKTVVQPGDIHFSTLNFPKSGSIEIVYTITNIQAAGTVFISSQFVNPSAALNQISVQLQVGITIIIINSDNNTDIQLVGVIQRSKRNTNATSSNQKQLFVGLKSTGSVPLEVEYKATGNIEKADPITTTTTTTTTTTSTTMSTTLATTTTTTTTSSSPCHFVKIKFLMLFAFVVELWLALM